MHYVIFAINLSANQRHMWKIVSKKIAVIIDPHYNKQALFFIV